MIRIFQPFALKLSRGLVDLQTADLRVLLLKSTYVVDLVNHDARNDISDLAVLGESSADLAAKSVALSGGKCVVTADPVTIFAVPAAQVVTQAVLYVRGASPAVSWLVTHYTAESGLPFPTDGGNVIFGFGGARKVLTVGAP